jgi:hypothetical protein
MNIIKAIIQAASYHFEQAKLMRGLTQKRAQEAKEDHDNNVRHAKRY